MSGKVLNFEASLMYISFFPVSLGPPSSDGMRDYMYLHCLRRPCAGKFNLLGFVCIFVLLYLYCIHIFSKEYFHCNELGRVSTQQILLYGAVMFGKQL